ncbi:hypothetical protein [Rhodococcus sp. H29-C3]|uniref:hypothetical protein n=1 Tax=Rhodococcus sp. H29-C3 TaxID=3046307 RepID=UPI0024BB969C|nr:hypothetical protein [Rhodococcus sp. H29-C3]MDJ0362999.1 hypothetical protein [Rhodococcus sp. H29-C3]
MTTIRNRSPPLYAAKPSGPCPYPHRSPNCSHAEPWPADPPSPSPAGSILIAEASAAGHHVALIGQPRLSLLAVHEHGGNLAKVALVDPGSTDPSRCSLDLARWHRHRHIDARRPRRPADTGAGTSRSVRNARINPDLR